MKPWEQTWEAREDDVWEPEKRVVVSRETDPADAKLIAAAPEMARLLLELEWAGDVIDEYDPCLNDACPSCFALQTTGIHLPECELVRVLVKAGVRAS